MRRRKRIGRLKILAVVIIAAAVGGFFFLRRDMNKNAAPPVEKHQIGYKAEDRQKLEQLIHQGAKSD